MTEGHFSAVKLASIIRSDYMTEGRNSRSRERTTIATEGQCCFIVYEDMVEPYKGGDED